MLAISINCLELVQKKSCRFRKLCRASNLREYLEIAQQEKSKSFAMQRLCKKNPTLKPKLQTKAHFI